MKNIYSVMAAIMLLFMLIIPLLAVGSDPDDSLKPTSKTTSKITSSFTTKKPTKAGYIKVYDVNSDKVLEIEESEYVFGVVASELPASFEEETMKAQAVAAYTVALMRENEQQKSPDPELKGADISNDPAKDQGFITRDQARTKWGSNYDTYSKKIDGAVTAVKGKKITYEGQPILAAYHAISSGKTESAQVVWGVNMPYLQPVDSVGDLLAPDYLTSASFTKDDFITRAKKLNVTLTGDPSTWIKQPKRSASGTVTEYELCGKTLTGQQIRTAFSLRSANFDLSYQNSKLCFTVRGFGHGVGMSQYGANYMAKQGSDYAEILKWYYPNCVIE